MNSEIELWDVLGYCGINVLGFSFKNKIFDKEKNEKNSKEKMKNLKRKKEKEKRVS